MTLVQPARATNPPEDTRGGDRGIGPILLRLLLFSAFAFFPLLISPQDALADTNVSGVISSDTTWTLAGSPYIVTSTVYVYKDTTTASTLTIEPGVEVRFAQNTLLYVGSGANKGALKAVGTATLPIKFTSDQATKTPGYWYRIHFDPGSSNLSVLDYVTVEYGGYGSYGEIYVNGSSPTIKNSTIQKSSSYGVYVTGTAAAPVLQSTTIKDNAGIGLYMAAGSGSLNISSMTFSGTGGTYSMSLPSTLTVTTSGTHAFDKPIELQAGTVNVDTTWRNLGAPYVSSGSVFVHKDATTASTLTIEPGVEVRFNQNTFLYVGYGYKGVLKAQGTAAAPIKFTSNQVTKTPGYWGNIWFEAAAQATSVLDYVTVEYGGYGSYGEIYVNGSSPTIKNSTIQKSSSYGVYVTGTAAPVIQNSIIRQNAGYGVYVAGTGPAPVLRANNFTSNTDYAVYNATANTLDARASWWNHASGPSGIASGTGEKIFGNVLYTPWLESAQNPLFLASEAQVLKTLFNKNNDTTAMIAALSASGNWTLQVLDKNNAVVKTYAGAGSLVNQAWNGDGARGKVADGTYTLRLSATSTVGAQAMAPLLARVLVVGTDAPVAAIGSPASGAVIRGGDTISVIGTAADPNNFVSYKVEYGAGASPTAWNAITSDITTPVVDGLLANWNTGYLAGDAYTLRLSAKDAATTSTAQAAVKLMTINASYSPFNPQYFSPNGDNLNDTTTLTASTTLPSNWTLTIKNSGGTVVRTFSGTGTSISQVWDGKNTSGVVVPEGAYTWTLEAVEPASGVTAAPKTGTVYVDLSKPVAKITAPVLGSSVFDTVLIGGTASDPYLGNYKVEYAYGTSPSPADWKNIATGYASVTNGTLANWITNSYRDETLVGNGTVSIRLTVTDKAGAQAADQVAVNLDNLLITGVSRSKTVIQPAKGETTAVSFSINQPASVTVRIVPETSAWKYYPDQTPEADAVRTITLGSLPAGTHSAAWDGKNDGGQVANDEAYIYVVEGKTSSGRFDKFNQYVSSYTSVFAEIPFPSSATAYNPYKNEFVNHNFSVTAPEAGRWQGFQVYGTANGANFTLYPHPAAPVEPGALVSAFWDGRNESGNILTGITAINYYILHLGPLKSNYILVKGGKPGVPGVSIKSDPYLMYLSYGQFARLKYALHDDANVTVTVKDPQTGAETVLVSNLFQTAGDKEVEWGGQGGSGQLVPTEGHYTFTVKAAHPVTGFSTTRRGNITVYK